MDACCEVRPIEQRQRRILAIVLAINAAMFMVEFIAGIAAHSTALISDSADMLGDTIVYGFSLYVVARGAVWQARAALFKGVVMAVFALGILIEAGFKIAEGITPTAPLMMVIAVVALVANGSVLLFLSRHRADDINMRSAWLCSRNDVIANAAVLVAAVVVGLTGSAWPDIIAGLGIAALFGSSAFDIIGAALRQHANDRLVTR